MPIYPSTNEPLSPSTPVTSSLVDPIAVPTHGPGGTFSVLARTHVAAPPRDVLRTIRNTAEWHRWNTFCPRCTIDLKSPRPPVASGGGDDDGDVLESGGEDFLHVGSVAVIEVFMGGDGLVEGRKKSRDQGIVVTKLEELSDGDGDVGGEGETEARRGYRIAWKSTGLMHWQLHSERVMELVQKDGGTDYVCWETFGGLLGSVVKATVGRQLVDRFGDYARDVKGFAEGAAKADGEVNERA